MNNKNFVFFIPSEIFTLLADKERLTFAPQLLAVLLSVLGFCSGF